MKYLSLKHKAKYLYRHSFCLLFILLNLSLNLRAQHTNTSEKTNSMPPVLLVVGDSISAGYGLAQVNQGWVSLLSERLKQNKYPYQVVNASISGDTTSNGLNRLSPLLTKHKPTVVLIELGANDALRGLPIQQAQQNLENMIKQSLAIKAKVVLIGINIPSNYGAAYIKSFEAMYPTLAKKYNLTFTPSIFQNISSDLSWFQADRLHPNQTAQPKLLDAVWPALLPVLKR